MESWYWRIDLCNLDIWNKRYIYVYIYTITNILSTEQTSTLKTAHAFDVFSYEIRMCAARQSAFNDLNLGNDVTLISLFRRPHLISFWIIEHKVRPKKYCKWSSHWKELKIAAGAAVAQSWCLNLFMSISAWCYPMCNCSNVWRCYSLCAAPVAFHGISCCILSCSWDCRFGMVTWMH